MGVREHRVALLVTTGLVLVVGALVSRSSWVSAGPNAAPAGPDRDEGSARRLLDTADPDAEAPPDPPRDFIDLGELCGLFRGLIGPTVQTGGSYFWEIEHPEVTMLDVERQSVQVSTINGGFGFTRESHILPMAPVETLAVDGLPVQKLRSLLVLARKNGVTRMESWHVSVPDRYHGQAELVVRDDVAVRKGDEWWICLDERSSILHPDSHEPLMPDLACEPADDAEHWWRCVEKVPAGDNSAPD